MNHLLQEMLCNLPVLGILDAINRGNDTVEKLTALGYDAKTAQEVLEKK